MQLLSICIPTFNRQKKLKLMLDSINSNTDVEIIICDDGSTDETQKIVDSFTDRLKIKYIYQKNLGVSAAILNAYNQASGKYLIKMDSDDCFSDTGLNFILDTIKNNEEKEAFLYGVYTNKNNKIAKNLPPNAITNFISVRADYKIQGDLKEVVRRNIVQKYMYKVPKEIKRIPPGLLWYRIAEKYNCLSFKQSCCYKIILRMVSHQKCIISKYLIQKLWLNCMIFCRIVMFTNQIFIDGKLVCFGVDIVFIIVL